MFFPSLSICVSFFHKVFQKKKTNIINNSTVRISKSMGKRRNTNRIRFWFDCAQLVIALFVPLAIIIYTIIQNNTDLSIAKENRLQDLKIADEYRQQEIMLSNDEHEEATLIRYFNSLGKLLEKNGNLENQTNIARFKTLTALAKLKSKRKSYLIRALIENKLIIKNKNRNSTLDLSLADLTNLDLSRNMLVNNEMKCAMFSHTTLTNSTFQGMILHGSIFTKAILINSNFASSNAIPWWCGDANMLGIYFIKTILDNSIFDNAQYTKAYFSNASMSYAKMRHFQCFECRFLKAQMNSVDLSESKFSSCSGHATLAFQSTDMSSTNLYKAIFTCTDFTLAILTMINATETTFIHSEFQFASLENSTFIQTIIINSSFPKANLRGSLWNQAKINYTNFDETDMTNVNFINSDCHYCHFNQTKLTDTNFTNSSLDGSDFRETNITYEQLIVARSLQNVILPNGTIIQ